jgi:DNA-binding transcriptional MerR regulator
MPHRPPLTAAKLAELYDRNPSPDVLDLLWEIHRLRATVLRADQIRRVLRHCPAGVPNALWEAFQNELDAEPCLSDPPTRRQQRIRSRFRALYDDAHQGSTAPVEASRR